MSPIADRELARALAREVSGILSPNQVLERCRYLSEAYGIERRELGVSAGGQAIELFTVGPGPWPVLLYGFPDPGEAVGGTLAVALLEQLARQSGAWCALPVRWSILPVLNRDDQPDGGHSLRPVFKSPDVPEVDWCLADPRPETAALLGLAAELRPVLVYALHDEYHSGEAKPAYLGVARPLLPATAAAIREHLALLGHPIATELEHPVMGPGFFVMSEVAADYAQSTFSRLETFGQVLVCEVSRQPNVSAAGLVEAQTVALLNVLAEVVA